MKEIHPGSRAAWVMAIRPRTLPVSIGPVLVGTAVAHIHGGARIAPAIAAGLGALLLQIGSNFANDVFDFEKGADTEDRIGPPRATQLGLLTPAALKRGMLGVFALAILVGAYLSWVAGPVIIAVGLVSIVAAIAYTGGPWPLGYHGLGDLAVFLFFGLVAVVGTTFVQTGTLPMLAWLSALPVGGLATAILVVNNLRDIETDVAAGKRTLAVRLGRRGARVEWALLVAGAYLLPIVLWLGAGEAPWILLPWVSAPRAIRLFDVIRSNEGGPALNEALAGTAQLGFLFSVLFALGLAA
ncbi:MAG: 1,4-dihydroxy-2-naphthoate polyprenyltransferase [bacterium]|nr:1,4-dihydroxy-2-naphthoate polyprenyltransferase [bacterium]